MFLLTDLLQILLDEESEDPDKGVTVHLNHKRLDFHFFWPYFFCLHETKCTDLLLSIEKSIFVYFNIKTKVRVLPQIHVNNVEHKITLHYSFNYLFYFSFDEWSGVGYLQDSTDVQNF